MSQRYITTITLNPSLDRLYQVADFHVSGLFRLAKENQPRIQPGGKGILIAESLSVLNNTVLAMGFCGGHAGNSLKEVLHEKGIATNFTWVENDLRSNIFIYETKDQTITEINEAGPWVEERDFEYFTNSLQLMLPQTDFIVLAGSIPPGISNSAYENIIQLCRHFFVPSLLHTTEKYLEPCLQIGSEIICPDLRSCTKFMGVELVNTEDYIKMSELMLNASDRTEIILSIINPSLVIAATRNGIKVLSSDAKNEKLMPGFTDNFLGGFINSYLKKETLENSLIFGFASALACMQNLLEKIESEEKLRDHISRVKVQDQNES
ncbi:MAG: hypothetical protein KDK38_10925 [Leptospiraceae bacterium]|nr:hypothetical protein [Leptospiraceae bacterium]